MGCGSSTANGAAAASLGAKVQPEATTCSTPEAGKSVLVDEAKPAATAAPAAGAETLPSADAPTAESVVTAAADAEPAHVDDRDASPQPVAVGESTAQAGENGGGVPQGATRGSSSVLPKHVSADELGQLCQATNFDRKQVEQLYEVFKVISSSGDDDGLIDKREFEQALGLRSSLFCDRIFQIFDNNSDANITFEEFVYGLSVFSSRASREEKTAFSFRIHDIDRDGKISTDDLGKMLRATITENGLDVSAEQFDELMATTFKQAGVEPYDGISLDQYANLVKQRPAMLSNMTIASLTVATR